MATDAKLTAQIVNLYAGRPVRIQNGGLATIISAFTTQYGSTVLCSTGTDPFQRHTGLNPYYTNEGSFKPILRPLSSMTEEEAMEVYKIVYGNDYGGKAGECRYWIGMDYKEDVGLGQAVVHYRNTLANPPALLHLCSLGFDLFGLIDAGLAIDSSSSKSQSNG